MKDLNLIPRSYILQKKQKVKRMYLIAAVIAASVVASVAIALPLLIKSTLYIEKTGLESNVRTMTNYENLEKQLEVVKSEYNKREDESSKLENQRFDAIALLEVLERASPEKLLITNLTLGGEKGEKMTVGMQGAAASEDAVASFIKYLREGNKFKSIVLRDVIKAGNGSSQCSFTMDLSGFDINAGSLNKAEETTAVGTENKTEKVKNKADNAQSNFKQYENTALKFKIKYPEKWVIQENALGSVAAFISPKESQADAFCENVNIVAVDLPGPATNLDKYLEENIKLLKKVIQVNGEISKSKTALAGNEAYKLVYEGKQGTVDLKWLQYYFIKDKKSYVLTYTASPEGYERNLKTAEDIISTMELK